MTADEAKQALKEGKKVRHKKWNSKGSYLMEIKIIVDQNGKLFHKILDENIYQDDDWEIME